MAEGNWLRSSAPQTVDDLGKAAVKLCWDKRGVHFKSKSNTKNAKKGTNFSNVEKFLAQDSNLEEEKPESAR